MLLLRKKAKKKRKRKYLHFTEHPAKGSLCIHYIYILSLTIGQTLIKH